MNYYTILLIVAVPIVAVLVFAFALCRAAVIADRAISAAYDELRKHNINLPVIALILLGLCATSSHAQSLPDAPAPQYTTTTDVHNGPTFREREYSSSRHPRRLIALLAVNAFAVVGDLKDIRTSEELFHQYGYIESNTWLVGIHPSSRAFYLRDFGLVLPLANAPSFLGYALRKPELFFAGLTGPTMFGIIHMKQGYNNESLLKAGGQ